MGDWTAAEVAKAILSEYHLGQTWAAIEELRSGTGYRNGSESEIDLFLINCFPSSGLTRIAYEIKVSRSDFTRELRQPLKRKVALLYSNQFYFAAPKGIIAPADVPPECGLVEVERNVIPEARERYPWHVNKVVPAPHRDTPPPSWALFASVARRLTRLEARNG